MAEGTQLKEENAKRSSDIPSSASKYKTGRFSSTGDALLHAADIPVYDGRKLALVAKRCIDDLNNILPRYTDNDGEIPTDQLRGYRVSQYLKKGKDDSPDEEPIT
ncbi:hypothetical protein MSAN_01317000 [Mycena sanguinolenta]|uniref:Uncharacterized protein n=1 Tax=Mycena sanguinolenta TaxID=230812 RepID=A0A8H7D328_9AGAR|nr:hypothetical protein MSAN_01317000 [Mycena sanguinolenta]